MLWAIAGVLMVLWALGFLGGVGGSLVHILLVVAMAVVTLKVVSSWRRRV
jgi:hypothetical protein